VIYFKYIKVNQQFRFPRYIGADRYTGTGQYTIYNASFTGFGQVEMQFAVSIHKKTFFEIAVVGKCQFEQKM